VLAKFWSRSRRDPRSGVVWHTVISYPCSNEQCDSGVVPTIRTERLVLREWREADREPFAALNSDPVVMEHFPALMTRADSDALVDRIRSHFAREGFGLWAIEAKDAPFVGFAGLARPAFMAGVVEIGWRLARPYWGNGYATEAAIGAARWGFGALALEELVSFVVPHNARSQRVMDRLGMRRDPSADFDHPNVPVGHPSKRHWLYRMTKAPARVADADE
jgi:ribosomal-protein-alanine N-acetyltransferase